MIHPRLLWRIVGIAAVILAGLGVGYALSRWSRPEEPTPPIDPKPDPVRGDYRKRALLVGVTKYDHLPEKYHLAGPGNDVRLMRRLLLERYQFPPGGITTLSEDEGTAERRPTRDNIAREFRRLADSAREGDQIVILLAGHGDQQPERDPPDPDYPEPDGLDEIFLPADVRKGTGTPMRVPNAIIDDEMRVWLEAITSRKAYVWIVFDCCHSGSMTRGSEVVRELPPGTLVPTEELDRARQRAEQRRTPASTVRGMAEAKDAPFVPRASSDYLVAVYACRSHEQTPEGPQPPGSPDAQVHGLLTYNLADILTKSAGSRAPLTYRELVQRLQVRYAARREGAPTPLVEGKGQDRVVLGTGQPLRPRLLLTHEGNLRKVNAGDLEGLTPGSVLAVYSPAGTAEEPRLLGHAQVQTVGPFDAIVKPCAYEGKAAAADFPTLSTCRPVFIDYGLRRLRLAIEVPERPADGERVRTALARLCRSQGRAGGAGCRSAPGGMVAPRRSGQAATGGSIRQSTAAGPREPRCARPAWGHAPCFSRSTARNLVAVAGRFEEQRYRGRPAVDVEVEVLRHKDAKSRGEVWPRPAGGWVFRPGDLVSFRVHNKSASQAVDVTLLIVHPDLRIYPYYPNESDAPKSVQAGASFDTPPPPGEISGDPPFGPEVLIAIVTTAKNPPADFRALAQDGLQRAAAADRSGDLRSPLGELLTSALFGGGTRGLPQAVADQYAIRILTWRTEPKEC